MTFTRRSFQGLIAWIRFTDDLFLTTFFWDRFLSILFFIVHQLVVFRTFFIWNNWVLIFISLNKIWRYFHCHSTISLIEKIWSAINRTFTWCKLKEYAIMWRLNRFRRLFIDFVWAFIWYIWNVFISICCWDISISELKVIGGITKDRPLFSYHQNVNIFLSIWSVNTTKMLFYMTLVA